MVSSLFWVSATIKLPAGSHHVLLRCITYSAVCLTSPTVMPIYCRYESNLGTPSASPIHGGNGIQTSAKHSSGKRLFAKLESFSAQLSSVTNEDGMHPNRPAVDSFRPVSGSLLNTSSASGAVKMPHNFIWVHLNATARIHTLKVDSSRLGPQLVDIAVLDKMHTEVLNSHSELHSKQATRTRLHGRSSSFAEGMSQVSLHRCCSVEAPSGAGAGRGIFLETALSLLSQTDSALPLQTPGGQSCKARGPATWTHRSSPL